ncbi:MAG: tyrosine-type recombinase/integrase [Lachnospiraceae bacterium]|nr:tyrosine-type recombinase/integrase [Lachnospiraceae bacterium]
MEYRIIETVRKSKLLENLNLVFRKENGVCSGTDIVKYPYKGVHTELGIENCRFYDLRGSYATKSLGNGVEIKDVADILGHSKIETTGIIIYLQLKKLLKKQERNLKKWLNRML